MISIPLRSSRTRYLPGLKVLAALILGWWVLGWVSFSLALDRTEDPEAPVCTVRVVRTFPHDPEAFTQGLEYHGGFFYEGTGINGKSSLRRVEVETGRVLQKIDLPKTYFGEGITILKGRLFQLTWRSNIGFIYDPATFKPLGTFTYPTEGWGLTHDAGRLIMSDGTSVLRIMNPDTFDLVYQLPVYDAHGPVRRLNELEFIEGEIWANVWQTDRIVRIDPESGRVTGWIDLSGLRGLLQDPHEDVLNGIAYDPGSQRMFVTGKNWSHVYEIEIVPPGRE